MTILVDENIPRMTVDWLRALGQDVKDIRGTQSRGLLDFDLWNVAMAEQRVLVPPTRASRTAAGLHFTGFWWSACASPIA
jgi:hypothetical protein